MVCDDDAIDGMKSCCATDAQLRCSTRCSRVEVESRVRGPGRFIHFEANGCSSNSRQLLVLYGAHCIPASCALCVVHRVFVLLNLKSDQSMGNGAITGIDRAQWYSVKMKGSHRNYSILKDLDHDVVVKPETQISFFLLRSFRLLSGCVVQGNQISHDEKKNNS